MSRTAKLPSDYHAPLSFEEDGVSDSVPADLGEMRGELVAPGSLYADVLAQGFRRLHFPPELEARFLQDKAPERLKMLRLGAILAVFLSNGMLVSDWLMVPDQFANALRLRLLVHTPLLLLWLAGFDQMSSRQREWFGLTMSASAGVITAFLCLASKDALAAPYLVCLAPVMLFNGGVVRMRFWMALVANVMTLGVYAVALCLLNNLSIPLMTALSLVLLSTAIFTLYGCYGLERDERTNWLMLQHEYSLLHALQQGNRRLDDISRHDPLTGLANRRYVDDFLQQVWDRARVAGDEVALLMMDIDHFKAFNDHYGHPEGDACLKDVATAVAQQLRNAGDLVGRFGGEEFIAVLHKTNLPMAWTAAERVRSGVQQLARAHEASPTAAHVSLSIGVASLCPDASDVSPARLIAMADAALYQAKSAGRNQVRVSLDQG